MMRSLGLSVQDFPEIVSSTIDAPRRDVIINFYGCPDLAKRTMMPWIPDVCGAWIDALWAGREGERPVVITRGASAGEPTMGIDPTTGKPVQSYLKALIGGKLGAGVQPGRIALVGFSAGCQGGVEKVLSNPYDAAQVDFVCALDGAAGHLVDGAKNGTQDTAQVQAASIQTWLKYALQAAAPDVATGVPSRCMVITHTDIINGTAGVASTKVTASAVLEAVRAQLGLGIAAPCIVPSALITRDNAVAVADRPGETWPSNWNICQNDVGSGYCRSDITDAWPVSRAEIMGNLLVVGFDGQTQRPAQCGGACSQPAHVFQSYWVHQRVLKDVLAPRWEFVCSHEDPVATLEQSLVPSSATLATRSRVNPATSIRRGALKQVAMARAVAGLGAVESTCGVQGTFSSLFTAQELASMQTKKIMLVGGAALALLAGLWWWRNR